MLIGDLEVKTDTNLKSFIKLIPNIMGQKQVNILIR